MKKTSIIALSTVLMMTLSACTTQTQVISRAESAEYVTAT